MVIPNIINKKLINLWHNRFVRSVVIIASGTAGAQAIAMALMPLITRLYGPDAYGIFGAFMATLGVAAPVTALAYPIAIILPRYDEEAISILRLSVYISILVALLVAAGLWFGGNVIVALLGMESVGNAIYLLPVAMLFAAWTQIARHWLVRKKIYGVIARSAFLHAAIMNTGRVLAGLVITSGVVLIVTATLGNALFVLLMGIGICCRAKIDRSKISTEPKLTIIALAQRYRDFPLYRAPQNLIHEFSQNLPILMLAAFFGPTAAGFYALAKSVVAMPEILLGKPVMEVFYPRINDAVRSGEDAKKLILKTTLTIFLLGIFPVAVLLIGGGPLFQWIFGKDWTTAGYYAQWLALWLLSVLMAKPSIATIPVLKRQRWFLVYEIVGVAFRSAALAIGFYVFESDIIAVALFSIVGVFLSVYIVFFVIKDSKSVNVFHAMV